MAFYKLEDIKRETNKCFSIISGNNTYIYCRWNPVNNKLYGKLYGDTTNRWRVIPRTKISLIWRHDAIIVQP